MISAEGFRRLSKLIFQSRKLLCTQQASMPKALVILSEGAEEMETVISVDVLRRGGVSADPVELMSSVGDRLHITNNITCFFLQCLIFLSIIQI